MVWKGLEMFTLASRSFSAASWAVCTHLGRIRGGKGGLGLHRQENAKNLRKRRRCHPARTFADCACANNSSTVDRIR